MRPAPLNAIFLDTRRSSSDCGESRREPRGSSRTRTSPCGSRTCVEAAQGLPLKCCRLAASRTPVRGTSTLPDNLNMCGAIVRQPPLRVGEIVGVPAEGQRLWRGNRTDLRARSAGPAGGLQPVGLG